MKSLRLVAVGLVFLGVILGVFVGAAEKENPPPQDNPVLTSGFISREAGLSESERLGRKIWFYATAGNDRFHTYVFQQRLGVLLQPRRSQLPNQKPGRNFWLRLLPRRSRAPEVRWQDRLS